MQRGRIACWFDRLKPLPLKGSISSIGKTEPPLPQGWKTQYQPLKSERLLLTFFEVLQQPHCFQMVVGDGNSGSVKPRSKNCCNLQFFCWKMSDSAQSPVKQKTSFKRQKNGKSNPLYGNKRQCFLQICLLLHFPENNHFLWFSLPYITITAFQFSKQPAINIPHNYHFSNANDTK